MACDRVAVNYLIPILDYLGKPSGLMGVLRKPVKEAEGLENSLVNKPVDVCNPTIPEQIRDLGYPPSSLGNPDYIGIIAKWLGDKTAIRLFGNQRK